MLKGERNQGHRGVQIGFQFIAGVLVGVPSRQVGEFNIIGFEAQTQINLNFRLVRIKNLVINFDFQFGFDLSISTMNIFYKVQCLVFWM